MICLATRFAVQRRVKTFSRWQLFAFFIWFFGKSCGTEKVRPAKPLLFLAALVPQGALSTGFVKEGLIFTP